MITSKFGSIAWLVAAIGASAMSARAQTPTFDVHVESTVAPQAEFASIAHLVALDATRAIVLDDRTVDVSLVSLASPTARVLSRHGDGPGEFRNTSVMGSYRDSAWIVSLCKAKFVLMPVTGGPGITIDPGSSAVPVAEGQRVSLQALLSNRTTLALKQYRPQLQGDPGHRISSLLIGSADGTRWSEIATLNTVGPFDVEIRNPGASGPTAIRSMAFENLFRASDKLVPRSDGSRFVIIRQHPSDGGGPATVRVELYDVQGRALGNGRIVAIPPLPGSDQMAAALWSHLRREFSPLRLADGEIDAELVRQIGRKPDLPLTTDEILTADGTLWLRRPGLDDGPHTWLRIDLRTVALGVTTFETGCAPLDERAGRVWMTCLDNDAPVIRVGRITKRR
jgi:hypothetical protein